MFLDLLEFSTLPTELFYFDHNLKKENKNINNNTKKNPTHIPSPESNADSGLIIITNL